MLLASGYPEVYAIGKMSLEASSPPLPPVADPARVRLGVTRPNPVLRPSQLRGMFWAVSGGLGIYVVARGFGQSPDAVIGALLIIATALLPNYLWVSQKITGLPIFPLYSLTSIWIYGLPLVSEHPIISLFPPAARLMAALSLVGFQLLGTAVWYLVVRRPSKPVATCWMFDEQNKDPLFIVVFAMTTALTLAMGAGWISASTSLFSILRAIVLAMEALVCFALSYRLGRGMLSVPLRIAFFALLGGTLVVDLTSLLLINVMSLLGLALVAYTAASWKLPWRLTLASILVFALLHSGKSAMREKYWKDDEFVAISPASYPSFFTEWFTVSWDVIRNGDNDDQPESLAQRSSLMHLLLYFQYMTPNSLPFLNGESYKAIPVQFVPRIMYPDKPRSHEGTYILTIYYGMQTREDTDLTTIDIGLINEAYANFGYVGMAALAVILGGCFGAVSRWARHTPIFSFRTLLAVIVLASILQASSSASFYIASLYQNVVILFIFSVIVMRFRPVGRQRTVPSVNSVPCRPHALRS